MLDLNVKNQPILNCAWKEIKVFFVRKSLISSIGVIESTFSMVFGVPFQFSSQFDSKITIMTEDEAAAIRATEMFKLAERRDSEPPLPHPITDRSQSSDAGKKHSSHDSTTRSSRSQSDDLCLYTNSGPLRYEEEELIHHLEKSKQESLPPLPLPKISTGHDDDAAHELLTHSEEEEEDHHHEL